MKSGEIVRLGGTSLILAIATSIASQSASAQTDPQVAPAAEASPPVSDDIVVTAQKRSESIQRVPLAVQAVTPQALATGGVTQFRDLSKIAPSLNIGRDANPANTNITMRGIGTLSFSQSIEPSVAVQIDDVPVGFQARAFADLSAIQRIEVLRGPQTTLYGKSASAGLINILTAEPTRTLEGSAHVAATTDRGVLGGGSVGGPLSEKILARVAFNYDKFAGNEYNVANGQHVNGYRTISTFGKLRFLLTDNFTIDANIYYFNSKSTAPYPYYSGPATARFRNNPAFPTLGELQPGIVIAPGNRKVALDYPIGADTRDLTQALKMTWDLGGPTLLSITSHDQFNLSDPNDSDATADPRVYNIAGGRWSAEQWTQELRLVSPSAQRLRYTLGLFYSGTDVSRSLVRGPLFSLANWYATSGSNQIAGFGQLEFDILPGTTLIAGGRVGHEKIRFTFRDIFNGNAFYSGSRPETFGTYKLGIQHRFADDVTAFVTYSTGRKGRAYDISTGFDATRLQGVNPEKSKDLEIGVRSQFFDRHVTFNLTYFDTHLRDFQAQGYQFLPDGTNIMRLANVGRIRTHGLEGDALIRVGSDFDLSATAAYVDARIVDYPNAFCYPLQTVAQGCVNNRQNLAGARPPLAPEFKYSIGANFHHPVNDGRYELLANGLYTHQSKVVFTLSQDPVTTQRGFGVANFSVGVQDTKTKLKVEAFLNNAFDQKYYSNIVNNNGMFGGAAVYGAILPRDYLRYGGVRTSISF